MPWVRVTFDPEQEINLDSNELVTFGMVLRSYVAEVLDCPDPGGSLTADDIEVSMRPRHSELDIGGNDHSLQIIVFANDFPSRRANLQERCERLKELVLEALPEGPHGFVWIRLAPAAFAEF